MEVKTENYRFKEFSLKILYLEELVRYFTFIQFE